ncbi:Histone-lysine N-methyltransferase SETMAR [Araneus ventricosus]|uniref:Histone-lysine N-methyltransferase SETMAR n=1 Tax=Araneus ventricosus TaxID=182803 RepID=A0A4Y2RIH2_ARAVE|nr:Histone-lysine N-methyltransferase SETMAR [Araneus ventricosus]
MHAQRLTLRRNSVVARRRECGHTSYRPLRNMQANKKEQRGVIRFLTAEGGREMYRRMKAVYGEYSLSRSTVVEWRKRFLDGRELLEDDVRPGQANRVITPEMIAEVHDLVLNNRRVTVDEIHRLLGISVGTTHTIMHQHLKFRKICAQWVPHQLTAEQRNNQMALSLSHLQRYHEEEYGFLSHIVTGDETWCHHFEPESKRQSKQWKHATSPSPKKSKAVQTSSGKVMMYFFYHKDPLLAEFLERVTTINAQRYPATLQNFKQAIKSKRPGTLSNGVILLHDNARPHTSNAVKTTLQQFR